MAGNEVGSLASLYRTTILNKYRYAIVTETYTRNLNRNIHTLHHIRQNVKSFYNVQLGDDPLLTNFIGNYDRLTNERRIKYKFLLEDLEIRKLNKNN